MSYFVVDPSGQQYGPADYALLTQWAAEGRVQPMTTIRDSATGQTMMASALPGLFPATQSAGPYGSAPSYGSPYSSNPYQQPQQYAAYPRPYGLDDGSKDATASLVFGILSLVCCGVVGLAFGILGLVFSKRAMSKGTTTGMAQAGQILSYIGIALGVLATVLRLIGAFSGGF